MLGPVRSRSRYASQRMRRDEFAPHRPFAAQANIHEGRLVLANPSPFVAGVLEATKLDTFFEIYSSVEEALESF